VGTGSFLGVKRPGRDVDHPPHLSQRSKKQLSYTSTPPLGLRGLFQGELYLYLSSGGGGGGGGSSSSSNISNSDSRKDDIFLLLCCVLL
jgi:hypothetical protein